MKSILIVLLLFAVASCSSQTNPQEMESVTNEENKNQIELRETIHPNPSNFEVSTDSTKVTTYFPGADIAIAFMNNYVQFSNKQEATNPVEWVEENQLVTKNFKTIHKTLLEKARESDPELGLGFDPIFDAQDYPEKGFTIHEQDKDGYLTLKGKDWQEFAVVVKVKQDGDRWFVDGAGVINIPENKRASR